MKQPPPLAKSDAVSDLQESSFSQKKRPQILCFGAHPFPARKLDVRNYADARELLRSTGGNLGNCIIGEYALRGIRGSFASATHFPREFPISPEEANEQFDHVLVIAANWFTNNWISDFSKAVKWFQKIRLPVTVIGLGQQLPSSVGCREDRIRFAKSVPESFVRLLHIWLDHGPSIAVRGETTQELLSHVGIRDVVPTGCPTWFVNGPYQPRITATERLAADAKIAIHGSFRSSGRLFQLVENHPNAVYVIQSEIPLFPFSGCKAPSPAALPRLLRRASGLHPAVVAGRNPAFLHFVRLAEWEGFLRTCSFSFGQRIHGTICAIKNGVPAVIIRHDQRIAEFVDLFKIPCVDPADLENSNFSIDSVYEHADYSPMNRLYPSLLAQYQSFLKAHGLEPANRGIVDSTMPNNTRSCPFSTLGAVHFEWRFCFARFVNAAYRSILR